MEAARPRGEKNVSANKTTPVIHAIKRWTESESTV